MEQVVIHLTGSAEEVAEALRVLAGPLLATGVGTPVATVSQEPSLPVVSSREPQSIISPGAERLISRKGPYSDTICAREGCFNKLSRKQVKQGTKYCSMSCAGKARQGRARSKTDNSRATIVAGEGVVKGSVLSEESAPRLPVPS